MPIVIAHLDRFGETLRRIATGARRGDGFGHGIVLHIPGGPIELWLNSNDLIGRRIAKVGAVIHFGRIDDLAGIEKPLGIKLRFDFGKCLGNLRTKLPANPLSPAQTIAMLATKGTFVFANELSRFFCNRAHLQSPIAAHIQNRAYV